MAAKGEEWEGKLVLVLPILEFRNHLGEVLESLTGKNVDLIEVTKRGKPVMHIAQPVIRNNPPPQEPKKLPVGKFTFRPK